METFLLLSGCSTSLKVCCRDAVSANGSIFCTVTSPVVSGSSEYLEDSLAQYVKIPPYCSVNVRSIIPCTG